MKLARKLGLVCCLSCGGGAIAQENVDCGYPLNQMEMTYCAEKGWNEADAELNEVYTKAMAKMRDLDSYLEPSLRGAANALKEAQRAWIPYRDKACAAYGFQARGGSMEPMLVYGCLATLTRTRIEQLKEIAEGLGN